MLISDESRLESRALPDPGKSRARQGTVAIVMANYNHGRYLHESLGGIAAQTRPADEVLIIDDGSTDDSVEIIQRFIAANPGVRFLRNKGRLGVHESISRVLPFVTSDYIVWTAADDRLLPHFLERSMGALERHPHAGLCFSETTQLLGDSGVTVPFAKEPTVKHTFDLSDLPEYLSPRAIVKRMKRAYLPIAANTVVAKREALLALKGYPSQLEWYADSFAYTAIALRYGACVVADTLAVIRTTTGSYSNAMYDPVKQRVILARLLDLLAAPEYRDIRRIYRACPSNFSPGWGLMLRVQMQKVRDWDLLLPYFIWKVREYKRGYGLTWGEMAVRLFRRIGFGRQRRRLQAEIHAIRAAHEADNARHASELQAARAAHEADSARHASELEAACVALADARAELKTRLEEFQSKRDALEQEVNSLQIRSGRLEAERDGFANALLALRSEYEVTKTEAQRYERMLHAVNVGTGDEPHTVRPLDVDEPDERGQISSMLAEIEAGDPVYAPSRFWEHYNALNLKQLSEAGFHNFKLTANQNYHNFAPASLFDAKIRHLLRLWRRTPSLKPLLFSMKTGYAASAADATLRTQQRVLGFTDERMFVYQTFVSLLWLYSRSIDKFGVLDRIQEPELGNPIRLFFRERLVSQDLATSSREFNAIMEQVARHRRRRGALVVAELGAGYGRLAHVFSEMTPSRYVIFDIPPALGVAQWYLTRLFPGKRLFAFRRFHSFEEIKRELQQSDIAFFTPNQMALFPDGYFDLTISISSLHEMLPLPIRHYLAQLSRLTRDFLYLKQYRRYVNPYDDIVVERDIYSVPGEWKTLFDRTEEIYTDFFELMQQRVRNAAAQA